MIDLTLARIAEIVGGELSDISPQEADSNVRIDAPVVGDIGSLV